MPRVGAGITADGTVCDESFCNVRALRARRHTRSLRPLSSPPWVEALRLQLAQGRSRLSLNTCALSRLERVLGHKRCRQEKSTFAMHGGLDRRVARERPDRAGAPRYPAIPLPAGALRLSIRMPRGTQANTFWFGDLTKSLRSDGDPGPQKARSRAQGERTPLRLSCP
jgi:hypothetical protein